VPAADLNALAEVHERSPIPVIADESVTDLASLRPLVGKCAGIDVKLIKCGGMREALRLVSAARALDLSVMIEPPNCALPSTAMSLGRNAPRGGVDIEARLEDEHAPVMRP
jgi:L-alanine-DL-glutamate epimerase-like enolase superfamily enzyme